MSLTKISITLGALAILGQLCAAPGLLTQPDQLYRVGEFSETHLLDLPEGPAAPPKDASAEERKAWAAADRKHYAAVRDIEVKPKTLDALKALVKAAAEKGGLPATATSAQLLKALGLVEDG